LLQYIKGRKKQLVNRTKTFPKQLDMRTTWSEEIQQYNYM